MFIGNIIDYLAIMIQNKLSEDSLLKFQEYLIHAGIFTLAHQILAILSFGTFLFFLIFLFLAILFALDLKIAIFLGLMSPIAIFVIFISIKSEKRKDKIENSIPDFLRQLSSILRVGVSLENALAELADYGSGPLYDELKRVLIEIKLGNSFENSLESMALRLDSKDLERSFKIILNARKSGGGLANVIENVSEDLRAMLILKKDRKSSVMMSVLFLIIASLFAAPFALGMVGIYSSFMDNLGKANNLSNIVPLAAGIYLIIHSILAGFLIGLIMYGDVKKGFKFAIPIVTIAYGLFYLVSTFGVSILGF